MSFAMTCQNRSNGLGTLAHHLDDAPDAVGLRPGTRLHRVETFFWGMPLDDAPSFLHWSAWWSHSALSSWPKGESIVRAGPGSRRSGSACRGISTRSWTCTRSATSPATAFCAPLSRRSSTSSWTAATSNAASPACVATSASTSTCWHSRARGAGSAHHATRRRSSSSGRS